jgi:hypothetical protein
MKALPMISLTPSSLKKLPRSEKLELLALIDAKLARADIVEWICQNELKNEKGMPLEFEQHAFLKQPYRDWSHRLVCMKSAQIGFSTMAILKVFWLAHRKAKSCIYTLPTDDDVKKFAHSKIDPILQHNPGLGGLINPDVDSIYQKRIGNAHIFWEGTKGQSRGIMVSADLLVHDELDRSDQGTVETYESRIAASDYKGRWIFSNPSRPNVGVDVYWQRSDKKQWHIKCPRCNEWQPLDYFVNVDKERKAFICRKCKRELPQEARLAGEWVAEHPGREWSGYHISQLMAPWITAAELIEAEETKTQEYFYNFVLGLPVIGGANTVSRSIILQCCTTEQPQGRWKLLGVDVGKVLHCVQGTENGITRVFTLASWDDLHQYMFAQGINLCVVDNAPETEKAAQFVRHFRGRAYRCIYDYDDDRKDMVEFIDKGDNEGVVYAHRTRVIDHTIEVYNMGLVHVYLKPNDPALVGQGKPGVVENCLCGHWETLYVVGADGQDVNIVKKDRMGNVIRTWENSGPDHFAHANVYYEIARQKKNPTTRLHEPLRHKRRDVPAGISSVTGY